MSKDYDVEAVQARADELRQEMVGVEYRHWKGGIYRVTDVVVDEATGGLRIDYVNRDCGYKWSRTFQNFSEPVSAEGKSRFERQQPHECDPATPDVVRSILSLADRDVSLEIAAGWTQEQRDAASNWAACVHASASDNDDVEVPEIPPHVAALPPLLQDGIWPKSRYE